MQRLFQRMLVRKLNKQAEVSTKAKTQRPSDDEVRAKDLPHAANIAHYAESLRHTANYKSIQYSKPTEDAAA